MNLSKLVDEDEPLFLSLIEDMFPGIKLQTHAWKELQRAITNQSREMGLVNYPNWNLKIVQLYETYLVRHGLMIMGESVLLTMVVPHSFWVCRTNGSWKNKMHALPHEGFHRKRASYERNADEPKGLLFRL